MCVYVYVSVCNSLSPLLSIFSNTTDPPTISGPLLPLLSDILGRCMLLSPALTYKGECRTISHCLMTGAIVSALEEVIIHYSNNLVHRTNRKETSGLRLGILTTAAQREFHRP